MMELGHEIDILGSAYSFYRLDLSYVALSK